MSGALTGRALAVEVNRQSRERMGLSPSAEPGAVVSIRVPVELRDAFMASCRDADVSASQVLRAAMRDWVRDHAELVASARSLSEGSA